jgi:hypothetical protein
MQYFLDTFLPTVKKADVQYYWFEGYDEPWKTVFDSGTAQYEDHWVRSPCLLLTSGNIRRGWISKKGDNATECLKQGIAFQNVSCTKPF